MIPSRLQFTIKMLNVLIIFKNNFFLTFLQSESVHSLTRTVIVYFSSYVTIHFKNRGCLLAAFIPLHFSTFSKFAI